MQTLMGAINLISKLSCSFKPTEFRRLKNENVYQLPYLHGRS